MRVQYISRSGGFTDAIHGKILRVKPRVDISLAYHFSFWPTNFVFPERAIQNILGQKFSSFNEERSISRDIWNIRRWEVSTFIAVV